MVKELVENALDADANAIVVELEAGGARLVRVRDDGFGIPSRELVLALSRHATSKIASLDDLDRIASMGFRGEALPSIASVSRLVLESRPADAESGARVRVDGGIVAPVEPAASKVGTTVEVRDLFFNVPARRKFLRTPRTELRHAEDAVRRLALSRPDVAFTLRHDGRTVIEAARRMDSARRLSRLLGREFAASALEIAFDAGDLSIHGFLAPPGAARSRGDLQFLFVNGRSVRDHVVRHAVRVGFGDTLAGAVYPAFVLHLHVEPAAVDVNVHPTKHEVRFREPRHIHDFVRHAIARALGGFASDTPPETVALALEGGAPGAPPAGAPMSAGSSAADAPTAGAPMSAGTGTANAPPAGAPMSAGTGTANASAAGAPMSAENGAANAPAAATAPGAVAGGSGETGVAPVPDGLRTPYPMGRARPGEARVGDHLAAYAALSTGARGTTGGGARGRVRIGDYVIVEDAAKLLLIDLRAGRGALVRDRLEESVRTAGAVSRPLLIPHPRQVSESVADAVDAAGAALRSLGIEVRRGAPGAVTLRAIPPCLAGLAPDGLLDAIAVWATTSGPVSDLIDSLAAVAESAALDGDTGDIVDAAVGGRIGAAVADIDESMLRRLFAGAGGGLERTRSGER